MKKLLLILGSAMLFIACDKMKNTSEKESEKTAPFYSKL
ncbi:Uncharacterised protein [Elizabethkingia anophelis]|nr:Uncharacterised protein [Elizabethkingia anophelis]